MRRTIDGMVVIITGASAGIGRALAENLSGRGARLVLAARRLERLEELNHSLGGKHLCVRTDVSRREECENLIAAAASRLGRIDTLVCNAGYGILRPVAETTPQSPINPYGWSKLMTERMLADTAFAHPINFCALRYFNVAGADPQGRSGQSTAGATHLIKVAVEAALGKRDHVAVFGTDYATPDGTGVRDYIHVSDLAAAHVLALEALAAEPGRSLTMNCGYGRGFSVMEVLDAVDRVTNMTIERRLQPRRAGDPDSLISDPSRIRATLPWTPRYADLDTIVGHALAWERKLSEMRGQP